MWKDVGTHMSEHSTQVHDVIMRAQCQNKRGLAVEDNLAEILLDAIICVFLVAGPATCVTRHVLRKRTG